MPANQKKVKWIIFTAIFIVVALLALNVVMLISINKQRETLKYQAEQIERLENQLASFEE